MELINLQNITDEQLKNYIAVLQKQLKRTDKHQPHGHAITENQNLLQMYQREQERRKSKTA